MSEAQYYDCVIKKGRLYLPKDSEKRVLDSVLGGSERFLVTYVRVTPGDVLAVYQEPVFVHKWRDVLRPKEYSRETHDLKTLLCAHSEWTCRDKDGRIKFDPYTLINFFHLELKHENTKLTSGIECRVIVEQNSDFLAIFRQEDAEKFKAWRAEIAKPVSQP
jgi:DNA-binding transcriptional regulator/RsmH inhibitor MraZ